jgi:hypothetical protein
MVTNPGTGGRGDTPLGWPLLPLQPPDPLTSRTQYLLLSLVVLESPWRQEPGFLLPFSASEGLAPSEWRSKWRALVHTCSTLLLCASPCLRPHLKSHAHPPCTPLPRPLYLTQPASLICPCISTCLQTAFYASPVWEGSPRLPQPPGLTSTIPPTTWPKISLALMPWRLRNQPVESWYIHTVEWYMQEIKKEKNRRKYIRTRICLSL